MEDDADDNGGAGIPDAMTIRDHAMVEAEGRVHEADEYYVIPQEALQFLPAEWRNQLEAIAEDGQAVLRSVDPELTRLVRLIRAFASLVSLKHMGQRLTGFKFAPDMGAILDLEMLTTAFVVTYARLHHGGTGSGFSRNELPEPLRKAHDEILDLRNKRFAHSDEHPSIETAMEVGLENGRFDVKLNLQLSFYVGGAKDWHELVEFLDALMFERLERVFHRLKDKTGRDWQYPTGPSSG